jgi:septum formation protein
VNSVSLPPLILASQSLARRQLLEAAGLTFRVQPSYVDESQIQTSDPAELVQALALRKAETVAQHHRQALVLGADSILFLQGQIFGKPEHAQEARQRWQLMRGSVGELYTGHALVDTKQERALRYHALTRIFFAKPTDAEIEAYIATGEPLHCAGCFAIDGYGAAFIERIEGCHGNVIGLSLPLLRSMMAELGYTLSDFWKSRQA